MGVRARLLLGAVHRLHRRAVRRGSRGRQGEAHRSRRRPDHRGHQPRHVHRDRQPRRRSDRAEPRRWIREAAGGLDARLRGAGHDRAVPGRHAAAGRHPRRQWIADGPDRHPRRRRRQGGEAVQRDRIRRDHAGVPVAERPVQRDRGGAEAREQPLRPVAAAPADHDADAHHRHEDGQGAGGARRLRPVVVRAGAAPVIPVAGDR
ncbi:hypothetical protein MICRO8M_10115 [Microbacterium sp. 8M]|nr:hypothetical protein MICRO8M_10115 [Microbacterium sp. 8M]